MDGKELLKLLDLVSEFGQDAKGHDLKKQEENDPTRIAMIAGEARAYRDCETRLSNLLRSLNS